MFRFFALLLLLQACAPGDGTFGASGAQVAIPRVVLNCTTARCKSGISNPVISTIISTSSCSSALYGGVVSNGTQSIACNSGTGCFGEVPGWTSGSSSATNTGATTTTIASSTYNICTCINYLNTAIPWLSCDTTGEKNDVAISSVNAVQFVTNWVDH